MPEAKVEEVELQKIVDTLDRQLQSRSIQYISSTENEKQLENFCRSKRLDDVFCEDWAKESIGIHPNLADRIKNQIWQCESLDKTEKKVCIEDIVNKSLGEEIIQERIWTNQSINYPNLKGVSDSEIEKFIDEYSDEVIKDPNLKWDYTNANVLEALWSQLDDKILRNEIQVLLYDEKNKILAKEYLRQYLKRVKVFDRDDVFNHSKLLKKLLEEKIKATEGKPYIDYDGTVFITSPKGGHEFLSIFAYANAGYFDKYKFPSNITKSEFAPQANIWISGRSEVIKRVVFLDDIIASGEQTVKFLTEYGKYLKHIYKGTSAEKEIPVYFMSLCKRKSPLHWRNNFLVAKQMGLDTTKMPYNSLEALNNKAIWAHETMGITDFTTELEKGKLKDIQDKMITCAFEWSIPDGDSDIIVQKLYKSIGRTTNRNIRPRLKKLQ